jgi:hypothetical protein
MFLEIGFRSQPFRNSRSIMFALIELPQAALNRRDCNQEVENLGAKASTESRGCSVRTRLVNFEAARTNAHS